VTAENPPGAVERHRSRTDAEILKRLPPGQVLTRKWPVLSAGPAPAFDPLRWRFRLFGSVETEWTATWEEFRSLPRVRVTTDMHCVTRWSRIGMTWEGVSIHEALKRVRVLEAARFAMAHSDGGYTTNLPLADLLDEQVLLADAADGAPLTPEHGGPMRLVVPKLYAWKSAKWCTAIELLPRDRPGFWETYGYHTRGDPWREERQWGDGSPRGS